jgi:hypothetical protein
MPTAEREKLIRSVWENIARPRWNEEVHGRGASLFVPISENMQTIRAGHSINHPEQLEFRLLSPLMSGHPFPAIVCDGVIVEERRPWVVVFLDDNGAERRADPRGRAQAG